MSEPRDGVLTLEEAYRRTHDETRGEVRATVLIVEDDFDILSSLAEVIREEGYEALTAGNGYQALVHVESHDVSLIFLDLMMPEMAGWKFVEELRARSPDVPVVLVSAARDLPSEAARLGVQGYLQKPFDLQDIVRLTKQYCAHAE